MKRVYDDVNMDNNFNSPNIYIPTIHDFLNKKIRSLLFKPSTIQLPFNYLPYISESVKYYLNKYTSSCKKIQLTLAFEMQKENVREIKYSTTKPTLVDSAECSDFIDIKFNEMLQRLEKIKTNGSNWRIVNTVYLEVLLLDFIIPHFTGHCQNFQISKLLVKSTSILKLKNYPNDSECFKWALLSAIHYEEIFNKHHSTHLNCKNYKKYQYELD